MNKIGDPKTPMNFSDEINAIFVTHFITRSQTTATCTNVARVGEGYVLEEKRLQKRSSHSSLFLHLPCKFEQLVHCG